MDESNHISAEDFVETTSNNISHLLCNPQDKNIYKWAVRFLRKAATGFGVVEHEPWIDALSAKECSEVIMSNYKPCLRHPDLNVKTLSSKLLLLLDSPLRVDDFISNVVILFLNSNAVSSQKVITDVCQGNRITVGDKPCKRKSGSDINVTSKRSRSSQKGERPINIDIDDYYENYSVKGEKKVDKSVNDQEVKDFFRDVWGWTKNGKIKLNPEIIGELLLHLPECVEEVMIDMAIQVMSNANNETESSIEGVYQEDSNFGTEVFSQSETGRNKAMNVLSVVRNFSLITEVVGVSPKLFQMCASILNQLVIQSAGYAHSWSSMLSLSTAFAKETAKGRQAFYPLPMQSLVTLMEADPRTEGLKNYRNDVIHNHMKRVCRTQPLESIVTLLSHFPAWLSYTDPISLIYQI